jgi:Superfamily I DNA and RNA helicases
VKEILEGMNLDQEKVEIPWVLDQLSKRKTKTVSPDEETSFVDLLREIEKTYNDLLKEQNAVDFDDLLELPLELLKDPGILEKERSSLDWILVDEYQDVNRSSTGSYGNLWRTRGASWLSATQTSQYMVGGVPT